MFSIYNTILRRCVRACVLVDDFMLNRKNFEGISDKFLGIVCLKDF